MSTLNLQPSAAEPFADDLVEVGVYATREEATQRGLVVLAAGHPYWLVEAPDRFQLLVEREAAAQIRTQLAAYDREAARWPPPPISDPWSPGQADFITPLLWAVVVLAVFRFTGNHPAVVDRGALDASAVFVRAEWWRVCTALFLHANAAHVISNALSGLLVFPAVLSTIGRARGWLLILLSAITGNLAIAALNFPAPYSSIGASTAIFAAVGLLSGRAVRVSWRSTHPHRWRAMFAPLAAGLTVLALHGAGGQRVDVGAHATGFAAGLAFGFAAGLRTLSARSQSGR